MPPVDTQAIPVITAKKHFASSNPLGHFLVVVVSVLFGLTLVACRSAGKSREKDHGKTKIAVVERSYSDDPSKLSIGLANKLNLVSLSGTSSIDDNKKRMLKIIDVFKEYGVNMILFPEFSLTGYFWEDSPECWEYMRKGVTNNHLKWLAEVKSKLDGRLHYIVFNNIRLDYTKPDGKFLNSTYVIDKDFDCTDLNSETNEKNHIYDKTFLPGIENTFTKSGKKDVLVLDTKWGKFGFATCYDMCFAQFFQDYATFDKVDAMIEVASWRGTSERNYPGMNVQTDHYYGFIWDLMAPAQAAFNQIWVIAANAVGPQKKGKYEFWGGSGVWAPSGMKLVQGSNEAEQLIVVHNLDIKGQTKFERDDFFYFRDFNKIYHPIEGRRAFTRMDK